MSICIQRFSEVASTDKAVLQQALQHFYLAPPPEYYRLADSALDRYSYSATPFHCDLLERIQRGNTVLELGCGTAHLCPRVTERGSSYTGMDYGPDLLQQNRHRFPFATFLDIQSEPAEQFDVVASLYTIEHVVDPISYLERAWRLCKPGGLLAFICPEFIDTDTLPPSLFYGRTSLRLREKLRAWKLIDACSHLIDLCHRAPRWHSTAKSAEPGAFWINIKPRFLYGASYTIDADAIHLVGLRDLKWWLSRKGAEIVATSDSIGNAPLEVRRYNCYIVARKARIRVDTGF
jgi:ubiquinone/menaquinone biosynthesis C-methylase UbiE